MSTEKIVCEYCGERFISEVDLEAHKFNNKYCSPTPSNPPSVIGEEDYKYPTYEQAGGSKKWDDMSELEKANYNLCKALNALAVSKTTIKRLRSKSLPPNKEQEGGLRWVKASERLPEKVGEQYYLKIVNDKGYKFKIIGVFMWKNRKREQRNFYNVGINWYKNELTNVTEWLEELPPTPDTSK